MRNLFIWIFFIFVKITSFSQTLNTDSLLKYFNGYKVDTALLNISKKKDFGKSYWQNTGVFSDIIVGLFQKNYEVYGPPQGEAYCVFSPAICNGDFNNDGFIDVFNAGAASGGKKANLSFLIWNPVSKKFDEKNLINDKTDFIGSPRLVNAIYLNSDNYVDLVIHGARDEGYDFDKSIKEPVSVCLSDGKGGYDIIKLDLEPKNLADHFSHEGGDVGDANGDGYPDLFVPTGPHSYIFWGIPSYPYFTNLNFAHFSYDTVNFTSDNSFGEIVPEGAGDVYAGHFEDINSDGKLDLLLGGSEQESNNSYQRIMINQGAGRFNKSGLIKMPFYKDFPNYKSSNNNGINQFDHVVDDLNGDGLKDIITLNAMNYKDWYILVYIQNPDRTFKIDTNWFNNKIHYTGNPPIWKFRLVYYDFNGDGKKDISYLDASIIPYTDSTNEISRKKVYIRKGNKFEEQDFFQYDAYAKYLFDSVRNKPNCPRQFLRKPILSSFPKSFCPGDSVKISMTNELKIDNVLKTDSLKWYFGKFTDFTNVTSKVFKDSLSVYIIRKDSIGCEVSSDTIKLSKYAIPSSPTLSRDLDNNLVASSNGIAWYKNGEKISDTTQKIKPTSNGNYTATTTQNGCTSSASVNYYYLTSAVTNLTGDEYLRISPNPTDGEIYLNYNIRSTRDVFISVIDMSGRTIISNRKVISGSKVNLGSSMKGNYIIQVKDKAGRLLTTEKLIKN